MNQQRTSWISTAALLVTCMAMAGCYMETGPAITTGGDVPVRAERLRNTRLTQIHDAITWQFAQSTVEISSGGQPIPAPYVEELLNDGSTPKVIAASWKLSADNSKLHLSELEIDGVPSDREVTLKIAPAGQVRLNLGIAQYNRFRDKK